MKYSIYIAACLLALVGVSASAEKAEKSTDEAQQEAAPAERMGAVPPAADRSPEWEGGTSTARPRPDEQHAEHDETDDGDHAEEKDGERDVDQDDSDRPNE
jgi:hypothetical protein